MGWSETYYEPFETVIVGSTVVWCKSDGDKLALLHNGGNVSIWSVSQQKRLAYLLPQKSPTQVVHHQTIDWCINGKELLLVRSDSAVWLWNEGIPQEPLLVPDDHLYSAAWSPDGHMVAAAGENGIIYVWEREGRTG